MSLRVPDKELTEEENGFLYYDGKLFTGTSYSLRPTGESHSEGEIYRGLEHGLVRVWRNDGSLKIEREMNRGVVHGRDREWHPNGQLASDEEVEWGICVRRRSWDESGVLVEDYEINPDGDDFSMIPLMRRWHENIIYPDEEL